MASRPFFERGDASVFSVLVCFLVMNLAEYQTPRQQDLTGEIAVCPKSGAEYSCSTALGRVRPLCTCRLCKFLRHTCLMRPGASRFLGAPWFGKPAQHSRQTLERLRSAEVAERSYRDTILPVFRQGALPSSLPWEIRASQISASGLRFPTKQLRARDTC